MAIFVIKYISMVNEALSSQGAFVARLSYTLRQATIKTFFARPKITDSAAAGSSQFLGCFKTAWI
jgi:hypothetical protein